MQSLANFRERLGGIPAAQEGAFSVRKDKSVDGTIEWHYEASEITGKITGIRTRTVDRKYKGVELKLLTEQGEATVDYPREFSVDEERMLLNQEINHRRFQQRYEEGFLGGGTCYKREYEMDILSGELSGSLLKSGTEF